VGSYFSSGKWSTQLAKYSRDVVAGVLLSGSLQAMLRPSAAVWHATGNAMPSSRPIGFPLGALLARSGDAALIRHEQEQKSDAALVQPERQPGGLCFCNTKPS
jgi:hypothetical protein